MRAAGKPGQRYAQKRIDVLDLEDNQLTTKQFAEIARLSPELPLSLVASVDDELEQRARVRGMKEVFLWVLTFDNLLRNRPFVADLRDMLQTWQRAYDYPVDVEFTANFVDDAHYRIDLVQCRPFQVREAGTIPNPPASIPPERLVLEAHGAVIGHSRIGTIDRLVDVAPRAYGQLPLNDRHKIARLVGQITRLRDRARKKSSC